jgi:hypothetical protein
MTVAGDRGQPARDAPEMPQRCPRDAPCRAHCGLCATRRQDREPVTVRQPEARPKNRA